MSTINHLIADIGQWYDLMDDQWSHEGEEKIRSNDLDTYLARTAGHKIDIFATTKDEMFCDESTLLPVGQWFTTKAKHAIYFNVENNTIISLKSTCSLPAAFKELLTLRHAVAVCTGIVAGQPVIEQQLEDEGVILYKARYFDDKISFVKGTKNSLCKIINDTFYINTTANLRHHGYISWNNKVYTPGLSGYHSNERTWRSSDHESAKYRIGFEVEKESDCRDKISTRYLKDRFNWVAEEDSSLSCNYGYELVSPIYNLLSRSTIKADLEHLRPYIDGGNKDQGDCGGHINISQKGVDGYKLLANLKGFAPLLYAMYPDRVSNSYSRVKSFKTYSERPCKQAFYPKSDRLEIRIFPVVDTVEDLMLRYELTRYMMTQSTKSPTTVVTRLLDPTTKLHTIITDLGFKPKVLAQAMLEADAKYDHTKYSEAVHVQVGKLGLKICTTIKPTAKQRTQLKKDYKKFLKSPFMKAITSKLDDTDEGYRNKDVMTIINARFEQEYM